MANLITEEDDEIIMVTVNRPHVHNALNRETLQEMKQLLEKIIRDSKQKCVILTGAGEKAFIAGADIKEMSLMDHLQITQFCELGQDVANLLENSPLVTIAASNGYTLGGGLEMALACDFIYASTNAKFGLPEVSLGLIPGFGGTQRLPSAVGIRQAKELIISGKHISAQEALEIGLINKICDTKSLIADCKKIAKLILANSKKAFLSAKKAINYTESANLMKGLDVEHRLFAECFQSKERKAAMEKFLNKT